MDRAFKSIWFTPAALTLIVAAIFITYSNTFYVPFQFDDLTSIVENRELRSLGSVAARIHGPRGVSAFTFALNYAFGGFNVAGYHAVNILIHTLNAIAAYFLVFQTLKLVDETTEDWPAQHHFGRRGSLDITISVNQSGAGRARKIAFFASLLFALHPIQTQAVTYIVQRQESLASLFYLAALLFFIAGARRTAGAGRTALYTCAAASYALAFHSKEMAFTLPAAVFLYDIYFISKGRIKALSGRWPLYLALIILMAIFLVRTVAPLISTAALEPQHNAVTAQDLSVEAGKTKYRIPGITPLKKAPSAGFGVTNVSPKEYLLTQFNVIVYYLSLLVVPVNQNIEYDFPISKDLFSSPAKNPGAILNIPILPPIVSLVILSAIIMIAVFLFFRSAKKSNPAMRTISFFILWFFILISPTSSVMPINDVIFEHRVYLASLGVFVIFVILIVRFFERLAAKPEKIGGA